MKNIKHMKKVLLGSAIIASMSMTALASSQPSATLNQTVVSTLKADDMRYTFEEFKTYEMKEDASAAQIKEAKSLFDKAMDLDDAGKYDEAEKIWQQLYEKTYIKTPSIDYTFEDFKDLIKKDATKADLKEAKKLFDKALQLENDGKFEEAMKVWDELYAKSYIVGFEVVEYTFEDFKEVIEKDATKAQLKEAEKLFDKAMKLEKENKYEDAYKVWDELYSKPYMSYEDVLYTFNEFKEFEMEPKASAVDVKEAEELFEKAMKLEESGKDEEAYKVWDELYGKDFMINTLDFVYDFDDFREYDMIKDATPAQVKEAKSLFDKAMALEKDNKIDDAMKVWDELYSKDYMVQVSTLEYTFNDFKECLKKDATAKQLKEAQELFDKAMKLEKEEKYEEASKVWDELYSKSYMEIMIYTGSGYEEGDIELFDINE